MADRSVSTVCPWSGWKFGANVLFFLLLAGAGVVCFYLMALQGLSSAGCHPYWRSEWYGAAFWGLMIPWGVSPAGCFAVTVLWRRRPWAWVVPLVGLGVLAIGAVIAIAMTDYAMTSP